MTSQRLKELLLKARETSTRALDAWEALAEDEAVRAEDEAVRAEDEAVRAEAEACHE